MIRAIGLHTVATYIVIYQRKSGLLGDHTSYHRTINLDRSFNDGQTESVIMMGECDPTTTEKYDYR